MTEEEQRALRQLVMFDYVILAVLVAGLAYIAYKVLTHA